MHSQAGQGTSSRQVCLALVGALAPVWGGGLFIFVGGPPAKRVLHDGSRSSMQTCGSHLSLLMARGPGCPHVFAWRQFLPSLGLWAICSVVCRGPEPASPRGTFSIHQCLPCLVHYVPGVPLIGGSALMALWLVRLRVVACPHHFPPCVRQAPLDSQCAQFLWFVRSTLRAPP